MLTKARIAYYKAFGVPQSIKFAQLRSVDPEKPIETDQIGLTVLVGPNNAGKSTTLNALGQLFNNELEFVIEEDEQRDGQSPQIEVEGFTIEPDGLQNKTICISISAPPGDAYFAKNVTAVDVNSVAPVGQTPHQFFDYRAPRKIPLDRRARI
jgi:ABC-type cobalamin/Fe3+-siderophores transport system ATPase subunit